MTAFTELGNGRVSIGRICIQEKRLQNGSSEQGLQKKSPEPESNDPETEAAALACDGALTSIELLEQVNRYDERREAALAKSTGKAAIPCWTVALARAAYYTWNAPISP